MGGTEDENQLMHKVAKIFDETRTSNATHIRKLKELSAILSHSSPTQFFSAFSKALIPLFNFEKRVASAERIVRFVAVFACTSDANNASNYDAFLENFLKFLLVGTAAANKTARFRSCQIISEIIMRLPDNAEVSSEIWDEVIECMKLRVEDKVPVIRSFAVRSLSRFAHDSENRDILDLLLEVFPLEHNAEVRKTLVLSFPPSNATSQAIIDCTLDVSESVRRAAYCVLGNKFPLQSLSIKLRTIILQRGLADRSLAVSKECLKLMKDEWLAKCYNGDPIELLKYLDVETYERVCESVMEALLKVGLIKQLDGDSIQDYMVLTCNGVEGNLPHSSPKLMDPEVALYWRTLSKHLQLEAQAKGSDAAATMGAEAAVYAAEASESNDLLERILPATVSDYIDLVKAHIDAGLNYRFASRQLLLLGAMLDFSDATNRKVASGFVQELLQKPLEHDTDENGHKLIIGDGINLGGDRDWADAVSGLARKVHASAGEFEETLLGIIEGLARSCRERTADFLQWMHSLAVTGLLLENSKSLYWFQGKAIEPDELLQSLLLPGAKHVHLEVQRVAVRCLGLFGLLERKPSVELVKQLRLSFVKGPAPISIMACKALVDLGMWHGPQEVDKAFGQTFSSQLHDNRIAVNPLNLTDTDGDANVDLLGLLYTGLFRNDGSILLESQHESVQAVLGEGFAKILLLSEKYPSLPSSILPLLLSKLISMYFSNETKDLERLKQCLSVFFEHYPSLSAKHKKCLSEAFVPVMRSMWPGINGNSGGSATVVSNMRKRATQASRFMLQMMQAPLYAKDTESSNTVSENIDVPEQVSLECGEEGLAIRIMVEVLGFPTKKTPAEKSYVSALCKVLVLLHFRLSEQSVMKLMRRLLGHVAESVSADKDLVKDLKQLSNKLKSVDRYPEQELLQDEANLILGRLELEFNLDVEDVVATPQTALRTTKPNRPRRHARKEVDSSDEDSSPMTASVVPCTVSTRSQRASKTAALTKMTTANRTIRIDEEDDDDEEGSDVTSEEDDC